MHRDLTKRLIAVLLACAGFFVIAGFIGTKDANAAKKGYIEFKGNAAYDYVMNITVKLKDGTQCVDTVHIKKNDIPATKASKVGTKINTNCSTDFKATVAVAKVTVEDTSSASISDVIEFEVTILGEIDKEWIAALLPANREAASVSVKLLGTTSDTTGADTLKIKLVGTNDSAQTLTNGKTLSALVQELSIALIGMGAGVSWTGDSMYIFPVDSNGVEIKTQDTLLTVLARVTVEEAETTPTPFLGTWGIVALLILLAATAWFVLSRRKVRTTGSAA